MKKQKWLKVLRKIQVWEEQWVTVPDDKTPLEFSDFIKQESVADPNWGVDDMDVLFNTRRILQGEIYYNEELINSWNNE